MAQIAPVKVDSTKILYSNIQHYSNKRKFTKWVYNLIFEPITESKTVLKSKNKSDPSQKIYHPFENKIIRNISIKTMKPFGSLEYDTFIKPKNFFLKVGNSTHYKTSSLTIKNLLLIKKNTPFDSILIKESERLIRKQRYIREVTIITKLVDKQSDSVDVFINAVDSWSLIPEFASSTTSSTFKLTDSNFLGTGHEFSNSYNKSLVNNKSAFSTRYTIPNILQTFIKTDLNYQIDADGNFYKFIDISRPFFSPLAKWGAGIYMDQNYNRLSNYVLNSDSKIEYNKFNTQDYWVGRSFKIFNGNSEAFRATNLITSARYLTKVYLEQPSIKYDSLRFFSDEKLYLFGIGLSSRKYTHEKYLFNFNVIEDVASGIIYNITGGFQEKNKENRYYFGAKFEVGKYFNFGYLSINMEGGTFIKNSKTMQSALVFNAVYFTNLIEVGNWKFRQFVKPQVILGINRVDFNSDKLTLNNENGIQGFSSSSIYGTKKMVITFQIQGYSPWNYFGFRLNPFISYSMGMLGFENINFKHSKLYSQIGAGIIISNDYLVFNTFQFSLSYYPSIPGDGNSIFKTNAFKTYDFGLQNFELSKPILVPFQ